MQLEMATALAEEYQRELARQASRSRAARAARGGEHPSNVRSRRAPAWRIPRYRLSWSRTSLSRIGTAGRRERSWVIVISATRGL